MICAVAGLCNSALSAAWPLSERSGSRQLDGSERIELAVPDVDGDLLFRFAESGIDLRLHWSVGGTVSVANAPGRRWGEQVLLLAADGPRPDSLFLDPVLAQAPSGSVSWKWQLLAELPVAQQRALALESAAAELAESEDEAPSRRSLELYLQALDLQRQAGSERWIELSYRAGQLHSRLGEWEAAMAIYQPALAQARDPAILARLHDGLGFALHRLGRQVPASRHFRQAQLAAAKSHDDYQYALSSNNVCLTLHAQGDMGAAAECLRKADAAFVAAGIVEHRSRVLTNLGSALSVLGRQSEAIAAFRSALDLQGMEENAEAEFARALVRLHLAWALLDGGRYGEALHEAMLGQAKAEQINKDWLLGQLMRVTAATLAALGQTERARLQLEAVLASPALRVATPDPVRLHYASAKMERDPQRRAAELAQVRRAATNARDDYTYVRAWLDEAAALAAQGQTARTRVAAQGALAMARQLALVEEEVAAMGLLADLATSDDARALRREAIALADRSGLLEQQYRLLHAQARTELDADRWAVARALVEEAAGLAHTLRQRLSADEYSGLRLRMKPMAIGGLSAGTMAPDLEQMARAEWLWRQFEVQRGWGVDQASSDVSRPADFHTLRGLLAGSAGPDGLDQATLRRTERLRMKLEGAERSRAPAAWPSLDQVQAGMREDSVMFVLLTDEPQSAALLVRPNQVELHLLASATQLESALDAVVRGLGRQDPLGDGALRARLAHLSDLLAPVLDALGGQERVQFLPGAGLEPLPLELLLQASSAPVSVLRLSSETLQQPRLAPSAEGDRGVLILQADSSSGDAVVADWTDLPAVGAEVDALKAMLPTGPVRHHRGIAAARTLDQLDVDDPLRLIHVASHALPAPYWSSLDLLAFGSGPEAQVPMGSLRQQRLQAELVVLSACRTALGGRGEMGLGFAQGFLAAGARQVLATAWPVDDRATAEFMNHFYQAHLLDGLEPAAALLRAQERMQAQQRWRAPYWWAGFQLWQGLPYDRQTPVMDGSAGLALRGKVSPNPVLR